MIKQMPIGRIFFINPKYDCFLTSFCKYCSSEFKERGSDQFCYSAGILLLKMFNDPGGLLKNKDNFGMEHDSVCSYFIAAVAPCLLIL
jgi:hypothetical protein